jgi:hypothetical protein
MDLLSRDHYSLPAGPDGNWMPPWNPIMTHRFVVALHGNRFVYTTRPTSEPSHPHGRKSRHLDIKVQQDCYIEIELANGPQWHWAMSDAITTGEPATHYFALEYQTRGGWTTSPGSEECRVIRFGAHYDAAGLEDQPYAFNMNIELREDDGVVPFTIDPDIRNPGRVPLEGGDA